MSKGPAINIQALKKAIIENTGPGKRFSRRALSLAATDNRNADLVRDILSRGQDKQPSFQVVAGLANALSIDMAHFVEGSAGSASETGRAVKITVVGVVEAGAWRQQDAWESERQYEVEVLPVSFGAERFGLEVAGHSMDKVFAPGTVLDCIRVPNRDGIEPIAGDIVIVERRRGDLIETTCKRLERLPNGTYQLRGESSRAEFNDPINVGEPDDGHFADEETTITGIVNASIQRFFRRH